MNNDIQHMLTDTIERYRNTFGEPPKRMRGSLGLGRLLVQELEAFMPMVHDPAYAAKHPLAHDEFTYRGVTVKCDLPRLTPTVLAIADEIPH